MTSIELLDPLDDDQFAAFHAAVSAAKDGLWDRPYALSELRAVFLDDSGYEPQTGLLARDDDGQVVGAGTVGTPTRDNVSLAYLDIGVVPRFRRRGHGTALFEALCDVARGHGRTTLFSEARWDADGGSAGNREFAEAMGFELDLVDAHRVLTLPATLPDAPVRDGYTLRSWQDACPEELLDEYANLLALITQEAPSGALALENEYFDAARIRSIEQLFGKQQRIMVVVVAVAADGSLAGHTQLVFPMTDPENVYQWDTLVLGAHRGHGLGLSLKVAAMKASAELLPGRRWVHTYNAADNGPMIAVNAAMGYRLVAYNGEFNRALAVSV